VNAASNELEKSRCNTFGSPAEYFFASASAASGLKSPTSTSVMFCGVLILYLKVTPMAGAAIVAATLVGMSIALYATREKKA